MWVPRCSKIRPEGENSVIPPLLATCSTVPNALRRYPVPNELRRYPVTQSSPRPPSPECPGSGAAGAGRPSAFAQSPSHPGPVLPGLGGSRSGVRIPTQFARYWASLCEVECAHRHSTSGTGYRPSFTTQFIRHDPVHSPSHECTGS